MSPQQLLAKHLSQLASLPMGNGTATEIALPSCDMEMRISRLDTLACALTEMAFRPRRARNPSPDALQRLADDIRATIRYLSEPLQIVEFDRNAQRVQLRSEKPLSQSGATCYYEFMLGPTRIELRRYQTASGGPRQESEITLTHDTLGRPADDLDRMIAVYL